MGAIAATRVTVFLALSPITAAALGVTLLGEPGDSGDDGGSRVRGGGAVGGGRGEVNSKHSVERNQRALLALGILSIYREW